MFTASCGVRKEQLNRLSSGIRPPFPPSPRLAVHRGCLLWLRFVSRLLWRQQVPEGQGHRSARLLPPGECGSWWLDRVIWHRLSRFDCLSILSTGHGCEDRSAFGSASMPRDLPSYCPPAPVVCSVCKTTRLAAPARHLTTVAAT